MDLASRLVRFLVVFSLLFHLGSAETLPDIKSIKITNTNINYLYIEELKILNTVGQDVASNSRGTTAEASEDPAFGSTLEGPLDDQIGEACCDSGYHTLSGGGFQSYTVIFSSPQSITGDITVWNRADGYCSERLDGLLFEYINAAGEVVASQQVDNLAADSNGEINTEVGASFAVTGPRMDDDGDGLHNAYETENGLDPGSAEGDNGAEGDPDNDGSPNLEEFNRKTDPGKADTDEDGVLDGAETGTGLWMDDDDRGTDPLNGDSDGDELLDGVETGTGMFVNAMNTGTDPNLIDTDGDGYRDNRELIFSTDPTDAKSAPTITATLTGVRSVVITNLRTDWFYIEEIDMRNINDEDVASSAFGTGLSVSEASAFGGFPGGAIDDIAANCCANGFHSSSDMGGQSLTLTFPEPQNLGGLVTLWDRQESQCCTVRLDGIRFDYYDGENGAGNLIATQDVLDLALENPETINTQTGASFSLPGPGLGSPISLTDFSYNSGDHSAVLAWESDAGEYFDIEWSPDLMPGTWETLHRRLPAAPEPAMETSQTLADLPQPGGFLRIRRASPPPIYEDGFEGDESEWISGTGEVPIVNQAATRWERGAPGGNGPAAAHGGEFVYGTDLDANYEVIANLTLRSPEIDLTNAQSALLSFWYYLDSSPNEGGRLEFLDRDAPNTVIARTDAFESTDDWTRIVIDLREVGESNGEPAVLTGRKFLMQFVFLSDSNGDDNGAGFYIDDLVIE